MIFFFSLRGALTLQGKFNLYLTFYKHQKQGKKHIFNYHQNKGLGVTPGKTRKTRKNYEMIVEAIYEIFFGRTLTYNLLLFKIW